MRHDPAAAILTLLGGGSLLLIAGSRIAATAKGWAWSTAFVLASAGAVFVAPVATPFVTLEGFAAEAAVWLALAVGTALALADGATSREMDPSAEGDPSNEGLRAPARGGIDGGLLVFQIAGTIVAFVATTAIEIWMGLELVQTAWLAASRVPPFGIRGEGSPDRDRESSEAVGGLAAALLFAAGLAFSTPVSSSDSGPRPAAAFAADAASTWLLATGLALRGAVRPLAFQREPTDEGRPYALLARWLVLARVAPLIAWGRLLFSSVAPSPAALFWTATAAAVASVAGAVSLVRERTVRDGLFAAGLVHSGCVLTGFFVAGWTGLSAASPAEGPSAAAFGAAWRMVLGDAAALLGLNLVVAAVHSRRRPIETRDDWRGLRRTAPAACGLLVVFVVAAAGLPPTATFSVRFEVLSAIWSAAVDAANPPLVRWGLCMLAASFLAGTLALFWRAWQIIERAVWCGPLGRHHLRSKLLLAATALLAVALVAWAIDASLFANAG